VTDRAKAAIYREAARRIADKESIRACWAINDAAGNWPSSLRRPYVEIILGGVCSTGDLYGWFEAYDHEEANEQRVLGLLFMAEMVEAGDA
jgi:hypothetical protein